MTSQGVLGKYLSTRLKPPTSNRRVSVVFLQAEQPWIRRSSGKTGSQEAGVIGGVSVSYIK